MARLRYNGLRATLAADLLTAGTTITFAAPLEHEDGSVATLSGSDYLALTILDATGTPEEIVHLTAYTSGATTGTVARAQEGTAATDHATGAKVIHAPTIADFAAPALDDLTDVDLTTTAPLDGDRLTFDSASGTWLPVAPSAAGGDEPEAIGVALSDETTAITTGTAKATIRMPFAMTLTGVRASLSTASSSGLVTVDINEGGASILSTKLTIDATEKTSTTAAAASVISDAALADDAEITFDIDTAGTGATGLKVWLIGTRA